MQEARSIHDSMNIPKIEFITYIYIYFKYLKYLKYLISELKEWRILKNRINGLVGV